MNPAKVLLCWAAGCLVFAGLVSCTAQAPAEQSTEPRHFRVEVTLTDSRLEVNSVSVDAGQARAYTAPTDDLHVSLIGESGQSLAELALYDPLRKRVYGSGGIGRGEPPVPARGGGPMSATPSESYEVVQEAKFVIFVPFDPSASALEFKHKKNAGVNTRVSVAKLVSQCRGGNVPLPCGAPSPR